MRQRFSDNTAAGLQQLAWWDWPHERLRGALPDLRSLTAEQFLDKYEMRVQAPVPHLIATTH
jgi:electron transfer flavoprotein alpha/beta subunit